MKGMSKRASVVVAIILAVAAFFATQAFISGLNYSTLPGKISAGIEVIPSLFSAIVIFLLLFWGFLLLLNKRWILGPLLILATALTAPLHADITANAVKFYGKKSQDLKLAALPAHPNQSTALGSIEQFISTKENATKSLSCSVSGCFVQVTGQYLDRVKKGADPMVFSPAGNCDVHPRGKSLAQLPPYRGKKPCYGALMFSTDGGTSFKGILPKSNGTVTSDEVKEQIGLVEAGSILFKFYTGNQSNGFGAGINISSHSLNAP